MGCLKLTNYKRKLPRRWMVLCRDFRQKNTTNYNYQFDYDNIGNRIFAENNGARTDYTTNELNQYTTENIPPPTFDDDGNQTHIKTSTGTWNVTYNGENRPVKFTNVSDSTFITMKYDYMGRRVQYISKTGTKLNKDRRFVYNGYTLTQELTNNNTMLKEFIWNPIAGIGSTPLVMKHANGGGLTLFYTQDANKNISDLVFWSAQNGIGAHYEYSPFGEITTATKNTRVTTVDILSENPFRFSSEYFDSELGLVYYNYRHYNPQTGRWISRDPIEEKGGYNLYGFVENDVVNKFDYLGKTTYYPYGPTGTPGPWYPPKTEPYRPNTEDGLSHIEGLRVYISGQGATVYVPFSVIDAGFGVSDFINPCSYENSDNINKKLSYDLANTSSSVSGPGRIDFVLTGSLTITKDRKCKKWSFSGTISAAPDRYNFDKADWGVRDGNAWIPIKEILTRAGSMIPGATEYMTIFEGNRAVLCCGGCK